MRRSVSGALLIIVSGLSLTLNAQETAPRHLAEARALVSKLDLKNTNYEHGQGNILWTGAVESHTDCSGFIDHLFMHTYAYDKETFRRWFNSSRPTAARYHDAIAEERGFSQIRKVADLRPGDLIAIKYLTRKDNTGHIMLVNEKPEKMMEKKPFVDGTTQWQIEVIDSSMSGHGTTDTRHKRGDAGKDQDGLGRGTCRIYALKDGTVAGFSWSTLGVSEFKGPDEEHVVLGRLMPGYRP